jgi:putative membrane protein
MNSTANLIHTTSTPDLTTELGLKRATQSTVVWGIVALFVALQVTSGFPGVLSPGLTLVLYTLLLASLFVLHGTLGYRLRDIVALAAIVVVVSNVFENLSIITGFPFGNYYYSGNLGPKLFNVPLVIGALYCAPGYFAWILARQLLQAFSYRPRGSDVYFVPLIAAFAMVAWDMTMDPVRSTIQHGWIWQDGGAYFGVPFTNFVPGWFLVVWAIFQLIALYLYLTYESAELPAAYRTIPPKAFWYQAASAYAAIALVALIVPWTQANVPVADLRGTTWMTGDIYQSMALVTLFTMVPLAVLSAIRTARDTRIPTEFSIELVELGGAAHSPEMRAAPPIAHVGRRS